MGKISISVLSLTNELGQSTPVYRASVDKRVVVAPKCMKVLRLELDKPVQEDIVIQPRYTLLFMVML